MNVEKLRELSNLLRLRKFPEGFAFSMESYSNDAEPGYELRAYTEESGVDPIKLDCGTVMCIGGWACYLAGEKDSREFLLDGAAKILDLYIEDAHALFYPKHCDGTSFNNSEWIGVTPERAADVIDYFIATGVVDWDHANG